MNEPSSLENKRLNAILAEYLKRKDAGQPLNEEALLKAYPDLADGLRSYFQGEVVIGNAAPKPAEETGQPKSNRESVFGNIRETLKPGTRQPETASELLNRSFGRYTILRQLGEGAMGNVYLAHDTALDRQIALKVPKTPVGGNEDFMARFTREARAAAGLKYPNICSVYDADQYNGIPYITMDFIDGVPLSRFIGSKKMQSVDSVLQMISTIAEAVDHAHSKGVIHRDLKPGNILVDATFRPHITDFGLARRVGQFDEAKATHEGLLLGTPAYMAPEQVKGEQAKVGPQSDIYSLGVMLFELLTSRLPFEGSVPEILAQVLRDSPPVPSRIRKDLTEDVDDLCLKMLRKEPNERYLSMAEVVSAIQRLRQKTEKTHVLPIEAKTPQSPFDIRQAHIEALLKKGQYVAAIQDLEKLVRDKRPAARKCVEWAQKQLPRVRAEEKSLNPAGIEAFLNTATQLYEKYDYAGCIQLLTDIPSLRRSENMEDLLRNATRKELEAEQLLSDIKDAERRRVLDGIEPLVSRLLKLKPGNAYAQRLWEAMQSYRGTPASRRKYRFENGRLQSSAESGFLQHWYVIAIFVGALAFLPGYFYATSYFNREQRVLTLNVDDDWLRTQRGEITLVIDGNSHTITDQMLRHDFSVAVTPGSHTVSVLSGDTVVHDSRTIEVRMDGPHFLHLSADDLTLVGSTVRHTIDPMEVPAVAADPSIQSATSPEEAVSAVADIAPKMTPETPSLPEEITNSIGMKLRLIPAGEFTMGSPPIELGRSADEAQRRVTLPAPFFMGLHEVTQSQYELVMGSNPSHFKGANNPVEMVSWGDAVAFCTKLSALPAEHAVGRVYRLPTEAEIQYACRAGTTTAYSFGDDAKDLGYYAWFADNSGYTTHAVGGKLPNGWGLHDMHGNVWEWCGDELGSSRVFRGGGWSSDATGCRAADRNADEPSFRINDGGFRVALSPSSVPLAKDEILQQKNISAVSDFRNDVVPGFVVETWASGLGDIRGVAVGANSHFGNDPFVYSVTQQAVLRVTAQNTVQSFAQGFETHRSGRIVFDQRGAEGRFGGDMFVSAPADHGQVADLIYRVTPDGTVSRFHAGPKMLAKGAAFGAAGGFGDFLFVINLGDHSLWRVDPSGVGSSQAAGVTSGSWEDDLIFTSGGAFGQNAYLTDGIQSKLLRIDTSGITTRFADVPGAISIALGEGTFGDFLYVGTFDGNIVRVSPAGDITPFLTGFDAHSPEGNFRGIEVENDQMWVTTDTGELLRVTRQQSDFPLISKESAALPPQISSQPDRARNGIAIETLGKGLNEAVIDQFTGRWRIINPAGKTSFFITLNRSFSAEKTDRPEPSGVWEVVGNEARITWSDGWRDILRPENGGTSKIAFKPNTSWDNTPDNKRAVKMTEPDLRKSK